jgi:hypothetical protein
LEVIKEVGDPCIQTSVSSYLRFDSLILESMKAQVHLVAVQVSMTKEPQVRFQVVRTVVQIKVGLSIEVVRIGSGTYSTITTDTRVIHVFDLGELGWPKVAIRSLVMHGHVLVA